jgi:hypothetical protein
MDPMGSCGAVSTWEFRIHRTVRTNFDNIWIQNNYNDFNLWCRKNYRDLFQPIKSGFRFKLAIEKMLERKIMVLRYFYHRGSYRSETLQWLKHSVGIITQDSVLFLHLKMINFDFVLFHKWALHRNFFRWWLSLPNWRASSNSFSYYNSGILVEVISTIAPNIYIFLSISYGD